MISESATILIVEDEQDIRELLAYNLEKEGYATVQAADGKEGWIWPAPASRISSCLTSCCRKWTGSRSAANSNATPARCASPSSC